MLNWKRMWKDWSMCNVLFIEDPEWSRLRKMLNVYNSTRFENVIPCHNLLGSLILNKEITFWKGIFGTYCEIESWDCQNYCHKQKLRPSATRSLSLCLPSSSFLCLEQSCLLLMCWFEINGLSLTQLIVPWQMWKNTEGKFAITTYTNLSVESWTCEQNLSVLSTEI